MAVPQEELGDLSQRIDAVHLSIYSYIILFYASTPMRTCVLADGSSPLRSTKSPNSLDGNIGHHPKRKKNWNIESVPIYVFYLCNQRNHTLSC